MNSVRPTVQRYLVLEILSRLQRHMLEEPNAPGRADHWGSFMVTVLERPFKPSTSRWRAALL